MTSRFVWNKKCPEWGIGVVLRAEGRKIEVLFRSGGRRLLHDDHALLEDVPDSQVPADSQLRDESCWPAIADARRARR